VTAPLVGNNFDMLVSSVQQKGEEDKQTLVELHHSK
jgi:hypothetical protein